MQPSFVGHQRATLVRRLVAAFDDLTATHEASVICITGGMGWGKTRLVQEFYRELAATPATARSVLAGHPAGP